MLVNGQPDAGDEQFWQALGIPAEMRAGIVESSAVQEVWPENQQALETFSAVLTQWRIGMGGPTGLDYTVLPVVMELQGVLHADRGALFDSVRVMENEALRVFADNGRQQHENRTHRAR